VIAKLVKYLPGVCILALASVSIFEARQASDLRRQLTVALRSVDLSAVACVLPSEYSFRTTLGAFAQIEYPRPHAVLLLAISKDCPFCSSALSQWLVLERKFPELDAFIYDAKRSLSENELYRDGIDPARVLVGNEVSPIFADVLKATPTVVLVARTGRVLGSWRGELTSEEMSTIQSGIKALLM